ncbi:MAG: hypothetical protein CME36_16175 [unclassified Hahellaceae]|nr:hypothetical protein [Hahellaceae bacterium]|tara:strand:+ start:80009 stop:80623 length:615 start_codon:yes stop_codon:yes gene_type:complete
MKLLHIPLLLAGLSTLNVSQVVAEPVKPLIIDVDTKSVSGKQQELTFVSTKALFGEGIPQNLKLNFASGDQSAESLVQVSLIDNTLSPRLLDGTSQGVLVLVGASLQAGKGLADQKAFKMLERPLIDRYRGEVLLSIAAARSAEWPFDTFEVVSFPTLEHYLALMSDPEFAPEQPLGKLAMQTYTPDLRVSLGEIQNPAASAGK